MLEFFEQFVRAGELAVKAHFIVEEVAGGFPIRNGVYRGEDGESFLHLLVGGFGNLGAFDVGDDYIA